MYKNCLVFLHNKKRGGLVHCYGDFSFSNFGSLFKLFSVISHGHFQPEPSHFIICTAVRINLTHTAKKTSENLIFETKSISTRFM